MKNEFLYSKSRVKAYQRIREEKKLNPSINFPKILFRECKKAKTLQAQELYIFKSDKENDDLEERLQNINNYELSFMRFF